ncbi:MAG: trypsin-like peptidase domain-containing protein [Planctomycetaceae bacterium]|nr:trypsin-like peptidase domain-containing protein [Planctomycetaceae bacterium]
MSQPQPLIRRLGLSVRRLSLLGFAVSFSCGLPGAAAGQEWDGLAVAQAIEQQFVDVIARCEGAIVSITKVSPAAAPERPGFLLRNRVRPVDRPVDLTASPEAFGSGVVIAADANDRARYVLTNYHVLSPERNAAVGKEPAYVRLSNHRAVRADVIAADPRSDLAVLRLDLAAAGINPEDVPPIRLGDASGIRKGQFVLALGNPYAIGRDGSASASWGLVSNISRRPADADAESPENEWGGTIHQYGTLLHVDTRLSLGTSGGALVNLKGELIGLTTSLAALEGYEKSVGFAIPIDAAMRRVIETLLQGYEVEYGFLGVQPGDLRPGELGRLPLTSAARVDFVSAESPAFQGGLRTDDLIVQVNDRPVGSADDLMREIGLLGAGGVARIDVLRFFGNVRFRAEVTLGKWPVVDDSRIIATRRRHSPWRGLEVDYPTGRRRFLTSDVMERYHHAVLVLNVAEETAAHAAGLRPGDFITRVGDVAVETPEQFHQAAAALPDTVTLTRLDGTQVVVSAPSEN